MARRSNVVAPPAARQMSLLTWLSNAVIGVVRLGIGIRGRSIPV